jgi:hypothetical protein
MTAKKAPGTSKPRGKGRPFQKGYDPRRSVGSAPNPMTRALREVLAESPEDMKTAWRVALTFACSGKIDALLAIAAYSDGKPVARQEQGGPGDFGRPDLSEFSSEELREFIHAVRKGDEQKEE